MSTIELEFDNQTLVINQTGAGIMRYAVSGMEIVYGYDSLENKGSGMGDVLFPFPGRVENAEYNFQGQHYKLSEIELNNGNALHGFVRDKQFNIVDKKDNSVSLIYKINKSEYQSKGYPFDCQLTISYFLDQKGLTCQAKVSNTGEVSLPFGLGFHPYFLLGEKLIDNLTLQFSARNLVEFDQTLKPTGKLIKLDGKKLNFRTGKKIGNQVIDNCFTTLEYQDGVHETILSADNLKIKIWQDENFPYLQMYSADTIGQEYFRKGFAIEPQTCVGYAFNKPEMGLKVLSSGEEFIGEWGIRIV